MGPRLSHYDILAKIGGGGMGVVYKARDTHLDRFVAIKTLRAETVSDPARRSRFSREAKAASALNHPGIITIHDIASENGVDFIAMEYIEGKTLDQLIGRKGLSLKDTLNYAIQAADALAKAHEAGIVHRDLKPSNIMVTDGRVKILDFGVAKLARLEPGEYHIDSRTVTATATLENARLTKAGKIVGTAAYMSPEQAAGQKVDARSDVFSFGAVLYEMITGVRAFKGDTSVSTLAAVLNLDPKRPSHLVKDIPYNFERIILRCLRKDPARRIQFMADLVLELEEIRTESGTQIAAQAPARKRALWRAAPVAALALLTTGAWLVWPKTATLPPPTVIPLTTYPGDETSPTFSPDGNQVAFAWNGEKRDNWDIYITWLGAERLQVTTDPARERAPAWSPDGSQIAFVREQGGQAAIYLTAPLPGSAKKLADLHPVSNADRLHTTLSWFPDGRRLVASELEPDGQTSGIFLIPLDPGDKRRLISNPVSAGTHYFPAVSPNGRMLSYGLCLTPFSCDVYKVDLGADFVPKGQPQQLTHQGADLKGIAWAADGRSVIYGSSLGGVGLWRVPISGARPERLELASRATGYPAVARAGNKLAYPAGSTNVDLWKFHPGRPPASVISSTLPEFDAELSPDGNRVVFATDRSGRGNEIWVANADGTGANPLTKATGRAQGSPRWSPDSRRIAFDAQTADGHRDVFVIDVAGGRPQRLTLYPSDQVRPSWSRDGKWIYFQSNRTGRAEIWRLPPTGGQAFQVTMEGGSNPMESFDGKTLYYQKADVVLAKPLAGGPDTVVVSSVHGWDFFPVEGGMYYVVRTNPRLHWFELRFLNLTTGRSEVLNRFESLGAQGLSVSPDRKTILYAGVAPSGAEDLMLIQNFR
jgi:Tol biopolymer transport system component/tRNA A-37 threonylcarbamoyl transferase component Bud32